MHRLDQFKWVNQMAVSDVVILVNISEIRWVISIIYQGDAMYLDFRGRSPCCLFKKDMDFMMDSEMSWIIFLPCLKQKDGFRCSIFFLWLVRSNDENLGLFREKPG